MTVKQRGSNSRDEGLSVAKALLIVSPDVHEAIVASTTAISVLIAYMIDHSVNPMKDPHLALETVYQSIREQVGLLLQNQKLVIDARAKAEELVKECTNGSD